MNILITGANGFVGQSLVERLVDSGHHVTALVRSKKNIKRKIEGVKWLEGDLLYPEKLPELKEIERPIILFMALKEKKESLNIRSHLQQ